MSNEPDHISWLFDYAKAEYEQAKALEGKPWSCAGYSGVHGPADGTSVLMRTTPDGKSEMVEVRWIVR